MKWDTRSIHRDVAYFYIGLIIAFSFSGIFLNHRRDWFPRDYVYETTPVKIILPDSLPLLDKEFAESITAQLKIDDYYKGHRLRENLFRVSYENTTLEIDISNGEGDMQKFFAVPLLSQMTTLHVTTNEWWIYYSDIFGAAMILIALTGMFISKGQTSFKQRGWKLAVAGLLFPLIFLFLLS